MNNNSVSLIDENVYSWIVINNAVEWNVFSSQWSVLFELKEEWDSRGNPLEKLLWSWDCEKRWISVSLTTKPWDLATLTYIYNIKLKGDVFILH